MIKLGDWFYATIGRQTYKCITRRIPFYEGKRGTYMLHIESIEIKKSKILWIFDWIDEIIQWEHEFTIGYYDSSMLSGSVKCRYIGGSWVFEQNYLLEFVKKGIEDHELSLKKFIDERKHEIAVMCN